MVLDMCVTATNFFFFGPVSITLAFPKCTLILFSGIASPSFYSLNETENQDVLTYTNRGMVCDPNLPNSFSLLVF